MSERPPETVSNPAPAFAEHRVLGTMLQCTSYEQFIRFCQWRCGQPGAVSVDFSNTHIVTSRRMNVSFRETTGSVDYFVPDSMPLIWVLNAKGAKLRDRVYGPTFMRRCVLASPAPSTHYLLGGSTACLTKLEEFIRQGNPAVKIIGSHNGYFEAEKEPEIIAEINRLSPDFIWVGLGTPKQQAFIHRHKRALKRGIVFAVGFAFDVNAGTKQDAPPTMQRLGLTWLYRMLSEPRRLGPRYLKYNSLFLFYLLVDLFKPASFPMDKPQN